MSLTAYQTGVASSPADLLAKLGTFAAANGWTFSTPASGNVFRNGTIVVGASSDSDELLMRGAITYNAGTAWDAQDNNSAITLRVNLGAGPFTAYHAFIGAEDGNDYLHCAVEISANIFRHVVIGRLVRSGTYTGGVYVEGTRWSAETGRLGQPDDIFHQTVADGNGRIVNTNHLWIDYDAKTNNWQQGYAGSAASQYYIGNGRSDGMIDIQLLSIGYQRYNLRTPLWPAQLFTRRDDGLISLAGRLPDFRHIWIKNFVPGDIHTIGGVDWMVFPVCQKTDVPGHNNASPPNSYYQGYAYRKN